MIRLNIRSYPLWAGDGLRSLPVNVWVVTATSFLTDVSSEMIHSLLPMFLVGALGISVFTVGIIEGLAQATAPTG